MKRKFRNKLGLLLTTILGAFAMVVSVGASVATDATTVNAADNIVFDATTKTAGGSAYNGTVNYGDWKVVNGANNNKGWAYFKMGGKKATLATANPCEIQYTKKVTTEITKVTVNIVAGSLGTNGMSVNSWFLGVYSDAAYTTSVDTVAGGTITGSAANFEFKPTTGTSWAKDNYYKVVWDLANTSGTNGIIFVDNVTIYVPSTGGDEKTDLIAPTNLAYADGSFSWTAVTGAESYTLKIDSTEYSGITSTSYDASSLNLAVGDHTAQIKAVVSESNATYASSPYSTTYNFSIADTSGITFDFSEQGYANQKSISSVDIDAYTKVTFTGGSSATKYYDTGTAVRVYPNGQFTITSSLLNLVKIVLGFGSGDKTNAITSNNGSYTNGTWTGKNTSVTFTVGGTSDHRRLKSITIYYEEIKAVDHIEVDETNSKTSYYQYDEFEKPVVTAYYEDSTSETLDTAYYTVTGYDTNTVNNSQTVTVTYTFDTTKTDTYNISVSADTIVENTVVIGGTAVADFGIGWDLSGVTFTASFASARAVTFTYGENYTVSTSVPTPTVEGAATIAVTVTANGQQFNGNVNASYIKSGKSSSFPLTVAEALSAAALLSNNAYSEYPVFVTGIATETATSSTWSSRTTGKFNIKDNLNDANSLYLYNVCGHNGEACTNLDVDAITEGLEVLAYGYLQNFYSNSKNTYELTNKGSVSAYVTFETHELESISIAESMTCKVGDYISLPEVTYTPTDAQNKNVEWSFDDETKAELVTIGGKQVINAKTVGQVTLTCTAVGTTITDSLTLTIEDRNAFNFGEMASTDTLKDGDRIVIGCKNSVASNFLSDANKVIAFANNSTDGKIINPSRNIIWDVVENDDKLYLKNEFSGKYLANAGDKTDVKFVDSISDASAISGFKYTEDETNGSGFEFGIYSTDTKTRYFTGYKDGNTFGAYAAFDGNTNGRLTLYKQLAKVDFSYDINGGSSVNPLPSTVTLDEGDSATLTDITPTKDGYEFAGWSDGTKTYTYDTAENADNSVKVGSDLTLTAQWNLIKHAVAFDANTATGTVPTTLYTSVLTTSVTLPDNGDLTKEGYSFAGWNTEADGTGTSYDVGDDFSTSVDDILYAQWSPVNKTVTYSLDTHVTSSNTNTSVAYDSTYTTQLTPNTNYDIDTVTVTVGGVEKTDAYNSSTHTISVLVKGDIVIAVTTVEVQKYTVSISGDNLSNQQQEQVYIGNQYSTTIQTINEHFAIDSVTVTMGSDITSSAYNATTHAVNIASVTQPVSIVVVTHYLGDFTLSETSLDLYTNENATLTVTPNEHLTGALLKTFESSDPSVVSVTDEGAVTALKAGTATITAEVIDDVSYVVVTKTVDVTVTASTASLSVDKEAVEIKTTGSTTFVATVTDKVGYPSDKVKVTYDNTSLDVKNGANVVTSDSEVDSGTVLTVVGKGTEGNGTITLTSNGNTKTVSVLVTDKALFTKVTDASTLQTGDAISLVCGDKAAGEYSESKFFSTVTVTTTENTFRAVDELTTFTLIKEGEGWLLYRDGSNNTDKKSGFICMNGSRDLKLVNTKSEASLWSISINDEGKATISTVTSTSTGVFKFNDGSPRFKTYAPSTTSNMSPVEIYKSSERVEKSIDSISLAEESAEMYAGSTLDLNYEIDPIDATNTSSISWSSSNEEVATVENGKVTAVAPGTVTITVSAGDSISDTIEITVKAVAATGISLNKTETTIEEGAIETLIATVSPENASNKGVTWTSSDDTVATVDSTGKVTAVAPGTAVITATSVDGSFTATCSVTVTLSATGVSIAEESATLEVGGTKQLTTTVSPEGSTSAVTYSSSNTKVATVDENGKVTAVAPGTATITVTVNGHTDTCTIKVNVTSVSIEESVTLAYGESKTLTPTFGPEGSSTTVSYKSSDESVVKVDSNGKITTVGVGTATITITADGKTDTCEVIVTIASVSIKESATLAIGEELTLTPTYNPSTGSATNVTYTSSNPAVATVDASTGKVTAVAPGTTTITITADGKTDTCVITVPVNSVTLNKDTTTIDAGSSETLVATTDPINFESGATWSSSNTAVATVDQNGKVTGVASGTAIITVTVDGKTDTCEVTVIISSVSIKESTEIYIDFEETIVPTFGPEGSTATSVTWSSSDTSVATVDQTGKVTAVGAGTATITVTADGKTDTCVVTVSLGNVTLDKESETLVVGESSTLVATLYPADSSATYSWSSSDTTVATVDANGKVTAVGVGSATITVLTGDYSDTCVVTVTISGVSIDKDSATVVVNDTLQLNASIAPNGATAAMTWSSSDTSVATVDANGKVTAIGVGTATITVTCEGKTDTCVITVTIESISINKESTTIVLGQNETLVATSSPETVVTVSWSSSDTTVATVDANGKVTAVGVGSATITATCEGKTDTCVVTVTIESITLNKESTSIEYGQTEQLTATITPANSGVTATWSSSDTSIVIVDENGLVKAVGVGSATITVTADGKTDSCVVTVTLVSVTLDQHSANLEVGDTTTLNAYTSPTGASVEVTYTSSNPAVATVDANGKVTAVGVGTATITVTAQGKTDTCVVTVHISSVEFNKDELHLEVGQSETLTVSYSPNGSSAQASYSSSDETVATVDSNGKVTAVGVGTTVIIVTADGKTDICVVTVTINGISVQESANLEVGQSFNLEVATSPAGCDVEVTYSSSNPAVATVDASGKVTAVGVGTATITATAEGKSASCVVTTSISGVSINNSTLTLEVGEQATLKASTTPSGASVTYTWTSSDPSIAVVNQEGRVIAVGEGSVTITVTAQGKTATCVITVTKAAPVIEPILIEGCEGSLLATSAIISTLAIAGAVLISKKKKED